MANLLNEYRQRHRTEFVLPVDEGLIFFEKHGKPSLIGITSSPSRQALVCRQCFEPRPGGLVLEVFQHVAGVVVSCVRHEHISPDLDLHRFVNANLGFGHSAVACSGQQGVEAWLWQFFIRDKDIFASRRWQSRESSQLAIEQMSWCVTFHPKVFDEFCQQVYNRFFLGRKYLLLD